MFIAFTCIFITVFFLSNLPLDAVLYAVALCAFVAGVITAASYVRFLKRMRMFEELKHSITISLDGLLQPKTPIEAAYTDLLCLLYDGKCNAETRFRKNEKDMLEYYTLWAHQIKTPIAAMRLLLGKQDDPLLMEQLFKIEQYVDMVLQYIRKDASDYCFVHHPVREVVQEAVHKYSFLFIRKKIELEFIEGDFIALTDEKWLGFVLEQLLSNALKYTPAGGRITLQIDPVQKTITVRDTGIGISPENIQLVRNRGFTGYNGRRSTNSTGIGLYLCAEVLAKLSCRMDIASKPGAGTAVTVYLEKQELEAE